MCNSIFFYQYFVQRFDIGPSVLNFSFQVLLNLCDLLAVVICSCMCWFFVALSSQFCVVFRLLSSVFIYLIFVLVNWYKF